MKSLLPVFTLWLTLVSTFYSCQNSKPLPLTLRQVACYVDARPDSALTVLRRMDLSEMPKSHCAYYAVLLAKATDKCEQSLLPCDSLLNVALNYYGDGDLEKAFALLYKSRLQGEMGERQEAIDNALKALEVLEDYPQETRCRLLLYNSLGGWYADSNLYDESLQMYQSELSYSNSLKDSVITFHDLSYIYGLRNQLDSTYYFIRKALQFAYQTGDELSIAVCLNRLSLYFYSFEESDNSRDSALIYARMSAQYDSPYKENAYSSLSDIYQAKNMLDSALYYYKAILSSDDVDIKLYTYQGLARLYAKKENYKDALHYAFLAQDIQDSLCSLEQNTVIERMVYRNKARRQVMREKRRNHRLIGYSVFSFVVLIFIITIVYQYRLGRRKRKEMEMKHSLEQAMFKLSILQKAIKEHQSVISLLEMQVRDKDLEVGSREEKIRQLEKEQLNLRSWLFEQSSIYAKIQKLSTQKCKEKERKVLTMTERSHLYDVIWRIYDDYICSMKEKYPRLTDEDLLYLCLSHTNLDSLSIALCLGFSNTQPINQRKYRLKEKMKQ